MTPLVNSIILPVFARWVNDKTHAGLERWRVYVDPAKAFPDYAERLGLTERSSVNREMIRLAIQMDLFDLLLFNGFATMDWRITPYCKEWDPRLMVGAEKGKAAATAAAREMFRGPWARTAPAVPIEAALKEFYSRADLWDGTEENRPKFYKHPKLNGACMSYADAIRLGKAS